MVNTRSRAGEGEKRGELAQPIASTSEAAVDVGARASPPADSSAFQRTSQPALQMADEGARSQSFTGESVQTIRPAATAADVDVVLRAPSEVSNASLRSARSGSTACSERARRERLVQFEEELDQIKLMKIEVEEKAIRRRMELELMSAEGSRVSMRRHSTHNIDVVDDYGIRFEAERKCCDAAVDPPRHGAHDVGRGHVVHAKRDDDARRPSATDLLRDVGGTGNCESKAIDQLANALIKSTQQPKRNLDLPIFSGKPSDWLLYKAAYDETTSNFAMSNLDNLQRLRISLAGEAKQAVSSLLFACSDPEDIMTALQMRFGRPEFIVNEQVTAIRSLPKLKDSEPQALAIFASKINNFVMSLKALNRFGYLYSPELMGSILGKLTDIQRSKWVDYASASCLQGEPDIVLLASFLNNEAYCCTRFFSYSCEATKSQQQQQVPRQVVNAKPRVVYVAQTADPVDKKPKTLSKVIKCPCSKENHATLSICPSFILLNYHQRWEFVVDNKLCFRCLSADHMRRACKGSLCGSCKRPHHELLHRKMAPVVDVMNADSHVQKALLKVLPVVAKGPAGEVHTYALLDDGSTVTLVDDDLARLIGAERIVDTLNIKGIHGTKLFKSSTIEFSLRGVEDEAEFYPVRGKTMSKLRLSTQSTPRNISEYVHLRGLSISELCDVRPSILIGQDNVGLLLAERSRRGQVGEPVATLTPLGWVLHGAPGDVTQNIGHGNDVVMHVNTYDDLSRIVRQSYALDALGVSIIPRVHPMDRRAVEIVDKTSKLLNGRWTVGLPWSCDDVKLPDNKNDALKRLKQVEGKCRRNLSYGTAYEAQIQNLLDQGYAEKCTKPGPLGKTWYLPHFGVVNPNKPGKLRVVFDAAASTKGVCLNDKLLAGPVLLQSLLGVLFRFRQGAVAVTADIKEMFLRVWIREEERDCQRFLWRGVKGKTGEEPEEYRMSSMIFGAASSPFTAIYIVNKNAEVIKESHPRAYKAITKNHYVDDFTDSFSSMQEARDTALKVAEVHKRGGFELRGWASNSVDVIKCFPQEDRAKGVVNLFDDSSPAEKILGVMWKPGPDLLGFNTKAPRVSREVMEGVEPPTKRQLLSAALSMYDPLGLVSPITISGKILLQNVWRSGVGWDERLCNEHVKRWAAWLCAVQRLGSLHIPRCYMPGALRMDVELHTFVDASEQAYAAACYWRWPAGSRLCAAKSRVCPLKPISIPRLELQAAVLGARLAETVLNEHDFTPVRCVYWSDSTTVIAWLNSDARAYKAFVANRLGELDALTKPEQWRWLSTVQNPADLATREGVEVLDANSEWFIGPAFLSKDEAEWPDKPLAGSFLLPEVEMKPDVVLFTIAEPLAMPDPSRFSIYSRLINATAYVLFFKSKLKREKSDFDVELRERAERLWVKQVQMECYPTEYGCLVEAKPLRSDSKLIEVTPYIDADGLMRARGRIDLAKNVPLDVRRPLILGKHVFTDLLLGDWHRRYQHGSTETVLNEVRQRYWVPRLRARLRYVAHRCMTCRVRRARPVPPPVGDLPYERLEHHVRPFTHCGLDYFGPLFVTVGRRREKRYGALFTCLGTRAVHMELAASLSTDSVLMALRRFVARRGCPLSMMSDNGTNFRGASRELIEARRQLEEDELARRVASKFNIKWKFLPAAAPHMAGVWERLVQAVKRSLETALKERAPKEEVLLTLLAEAENIVNSRPLTHVSTDVDDPESITPNHFLLGSSSGSPPPGVFCDADLHRRKDWRVAQRLADFFWARWVREYLPLLLRRDKNKPGGRNLQVGDVVVIADGRLPRNSWPRGIIAEVHPGRDGRVRVVEVRTHQGTYRRPAALVAPLMPATDEES